MITQVLYTFRDFLYNFGSIVDFINQPIEFLGNLSILQLVGIGIGTLLSSLFAIHLIRLFVG